MMDGRIQGDSLLYDIQSQKMRTRSLKNDAMAVGGCGFLEFLRFFVRDLMRAVNPHNCLYACLSVKNAAKTTGVILGNLYDGHEKRKLLYTATNGGII